jgi:hypothetical protein
MEIEMTVENVAFLALVIGALSLFGGVLAWASWMEERETRRNTRTAPTPTARPETDRPTPWTAQPAG